MNKKNIFDALSLQHLLLLQFLFNQPSKHFELYYLNKKNHIKIPNLELHNF